MFLQSYQSGHFFEVFDSKEAGSTNKEKIALYAKLFRTTIPSKTKRIFDKKCGFYFDLEGYANKLILPNKGELCLIQQFLVFQVFVHAFHHWTLEILVTDIGKTKRRIVLTSSVKEIEFHHFHVKSPIDLIRREKWLNLCIDVWSFMEAFPNCTFRSIDGIIIGAPCKIRKIFLMRNPLEDSEMDLTFPQGFMPVPKQVNFPEGFEHSNQIVTYRLLNFQEFQLSQQTQHIPEDPNEVYQYQQSQKSQFQKYEEQNTQQKLMDPDSDEEQPSSYFQEVENNEDEYLDVVYDPDLKCYFDPKTNEYYQLA